MGWLQHLMGAKLAPQAPLVQPNNVRMGDVHNNLTFIESTTSFKTTDNISAIQPVGFSIPDFTTINGIPVPMDVTIQNFTGISDIKVNDGQRGGCE